MGDAGPLRGPACLSHEGFLRSQPPLPINWKTDFRVVFQLAEVREKSPLLLVLCTSLSLPPGPAGLGQTDFTKE